MTVKELRKILAKLPDDTLVCKTDGEDGCMNLDTARYCPQYDILYLEPYWIRSRTSNIDMNLPCRTGNSRRLPKLDKLTLHLIRRYAKQGKQVVDAKHDGKTHHVQIIISMCDEYILGITKKHYEWVSLVVDDTREAGGKLGVGTQCVVCEFDWESLPEQKDGGAE